MNNNPSLQFDPSVKDNFAGTIQFILNKFLQSIDDMLPAQVIAYNRETQPNLVQVQPLIYIVTTNNSTLSRPQIASVPLFTGGGGGFFISFNLKPGDLGWIKANDRDISLFLQTYKTSKPNTLRTKSFSDAVFYPDVMRGFTIAPEDLTGLIISSIDGTVKIVLSEGLITLTAPSIVMNTALLQVNGNIAATGTITPGS
jgi:hypothetical protein